ncbi:Transferrin [Chionoecetes opilio]|uniref:Transferrin n=1 Tax=Chionoecetes opilio TaxID=41210 RepID=A0A8J5D0Y0_CHIOP|nr:Transferrin [Chionoecetes opilio]
MAAMRAVAPWLGLLLLGVLGATAESDPYFRAVKLCVQEGTNCSHLRQASQGTLNCIPVRDRLDCLKKMESQEADVGYFEAEDLKLATFFGDSHRIALQATNKDEVQRVYLLVHNASNPRPRSLCHPGLQLQRSLPRALYRPVTLTSDAFLPDIEAHMEKISEGWKSACIPGPWSPDPATDRHLKQQYPDLCRACLRQSCDADDPYAGKGALSCLLDHAADAAIISDVDFRNIRVTNPEVEKLFHYCHGDGDGGPSIQPLGDLTTGRGEPCDYGKRPLPFFMFAPVACNTSTCQSDEQRRTEALVRHTAPLVATLGLPWDTTVTRLDEPLAPSQTIVKAGYTVDQKDRTFMKKVVIFCVHNADEMAKCRDLKMVTKAMEATNGIVIGCLQDHKGSRCFPQLYFGNADVIALDSGDVYRVTKDFGFKRILSEVYDTKLGAHTSSYYAVAVVKANSNITSFSQLQGRKSCHTGIGKTAGWKLPVATLLKLGLINPQHCNYADAMAKFFLGGSCAPGANDSIYNTDQSYSSRLCSLCVGDGANQCLRGSAEPFYSYTGAFRCLVHGGGDVAFVKHTTVPDNTDGSNSDDWAMSLRSGDYKLLCPSHDDTNTAAVTEFKTCNLALVPAHEVVVNGRMSEERQKHVRQVLLGVSQVFGETSPTRKTFRLFGKYRGKSDLLFKDSAKGLKALSEDTPDERQRKKDYFKKLEELHSCEVHVCALEDYKGECEAMAQVMKAEGEQFECVSARDRMDCIRRVIQGQVDVSILPGSYLHMNPDLRVIAYSKDPHTARERFRYRAVMVVRRSTVHRIADLRGKKSCHTGYGRTTGWRIPVALLKREGVVQPLCDPHQSTLEHEVKSVAATFNRACIPGPWATTPSVDVALKMRYNAMCSMCRGSTCDRNDEYAGYVGALRCLTTNGGDVAFSKLTIAQQFFADNHSVDISEFGLMCPNGTVVDINAKGAKQCFWAARPWDTYVTHGGASDAKVNKLIWAIMQAKRKGEEDLANNAWYFNTLGISNTFFDLLPVMDNTTTGQYLEESRMNIVQEVELCGAEPPVRFCVSSNDELKKCEDLSSLLHLRGLSPDLQCKQGSSADECLKMISLHSSDVMTLDNAKRIAAAHKNYSLADLLMESYEGGESSLHYFAAVVKKGSGINSPSDLAGRTTCNAGHDSIASSVIDVQLSDCLRGGDFFPTLADAIKCLMGSGKDVAFVKLNIASHGKNWDDDIKGVNSENFELLCETRVMPISIKNVEECNFGRLPGNMSESGARKENMRHLFLKASKYFGGVDSFFRLFYNYFSHKDLMFKDVTASLVKVPDDHHERLMEGLLKYSCNLHEHQSTG